MDKMTKSPFFRLLLPLVSGIVIQYYYHIGKWGIIPIVLGLGIMLYSYFVPEAKRLSRQFVFGYGVYLMMLGIGISSTMIRQQISAFNFQDVSEVYTATVIDLPQEKPRSYAYKVKLKDSDKQIVCYFSEDNILNKLNVGDTFTFFSQIQSFKNRGNADEFDYARYMYNKGYAGMTFVRSDRWQKEGYSDNNLFMKATRCRQYILKVYESLDLTRNEYAMLSALTLGYTDALSDEIVESFRATGVAHILAVSGMHVMIIFTVITSLLGFISRHSRYHWVKQVTVILFLWTYVFVIGFPPSALRACIMLTAFCVADMKGVRSYSFNTLFATAFLMLVWNPFWLFDMGFQLSFLAVLSMLFFMPVLSKMIPVRNKQLRYLRDIFNVSLSVQLGVFPLCLYYFGTFPVYFFITNLIIIPLITLAVYDAILIVFLAAIGTVNSSLAGYLYYLPIQLFKLLVKGTTWVSSFFEHLPYASLQNLKPSFIGLVLLWVIVVSTTYFFVKRKPKALIVSLASVLVLIGFAIKSTIDNKNTLIVYNRLQSTQVTYYIGYCKDEITGVDNHRLVVLNGLKYLIVAQDTWKGRFPTQKMKVDYLHLIENESLSLYSLNQVFDVGKVVLDGSLSEKTLKRFVLECEKLRIPYYDVSDNGVLRIFF
ncbi:competence protein ComEC [Dysgonomonas alginatilytica]|uniref:Competence protein ComEC n=1 Tax=Dysgonomonas alginatilytica TaxID=1605892 RepID=A0A2V3PSM8_9BACT|nr:ComEC/Rec2 family competence protein [Dysgonomonas alginatilytica]PXV65521.1 competence protein ComEC [Dysgonomonas alginatilytica]